MKRLVIITGASSGIGAAMAKVFSDAEFSLGLISRNKTKMQALKLPNTLCLSADVTNKDSIHHAIEIAKNKFGPVDCLINNAAVVKGGDFTELSHEDHFNTVNVNLTGVINAIEIVLPGMRERKTGTIINNLPLKFPNS